jgi:hypothetical protein
MRGPDSATVLRVLQRASRDDGPSCELCGRRLTGLRGEHWSLHHRRGRDAKADSHSPQNLLVVHGASNVDQCHGRIHGNRYEAEENGWWLSRVAGVDPLTVKVQLHDRLVFFAADGSYSEGVDSVG